MGENEKPRQREPGDDDDVPAPPRFTARFREPAERLLLEVLEGLVNSPEIVEYERDSLKTKVSQLRELIQGGAR